MKRVAIAVVVGLAVLGGCAPSGDTSGACAEALQEADRMLGYSAEVISEQSSVIQSVADGTVTAAKVNASTDRIRSIHATVLESNYLELKEACTAG